MKRKKVLIASEVKEELIDVFNFVKNKDISLFIFLSSNLDFTEKGEFKIYQERKISNIKIIQKIYGLLYFLYISFRLRPEVIFSGSSMLKYRLVSRIFSIYHIAYFRAVLFDSSNKSGICDRLYYSGLGKIKALKDLLCAFYADLVIVTSERSEKFILDRDKSISIISSHPIWLENFEKVKFSKENCKGFIFLTQAFDSHGFPDQHNSQISSLKIIDRYCFDNGYDLIVRIHPRDYFDYQSIKFLSGVVFDRSEPKEFLSKKEVLSNFIVISPLSTFAFEISYLGGEVVFYSSESLELVYGKSYRDLGIKTISIDERFSIDSLRESSGFDIFSEVNVDFQNKINSIFEMSHDKAL